MEKFILLILLLSYNKISRSIEFKNIDEYLALAIINEENEKFLHLYLI